VIAGLHMGMLAGIAFFALRAAMALIPRLALYHPTKKYAALGALALAFLYMLLSGATVSSRRAFVMIGIALVAVILDRVSLSARAVAIAAAAIMLLSPESATGPSFQMSFAAVAALITCYEAMRPKLREWRHEAGPWRRAGLYLLGIAFTSVITTAATMPFTIYHFNRFPLYSVAANAVAVPVTGFWVMPWAIAALFAMPFGLEAPALAMMGKGIAVIVWVAHFVTSWPDAVVAMRSMSPLSLMLLSAGGLWLAIWRGPWRILGLGPIAAGIVAAALVRPPDLLVAGGGQLVAALGPDGLYLPSSKEAARALASAAQRAGGAIGAVWPDDGSVGAMSCDAEACLYRARGRLIALERGGTGLAVDCRSADLVVSPVAAHRACRGPPIIDRIDLWREGAHAIWLDRDGIEIETVREWQGDRPWSPPRALSSAASIRRDGPEP
jgi:competence protein ComEC